MLMARRRSSSDEDEYDYHSEGETIKRWIRRFLWLLCGFCTIFAVCFTCVFLFQLLDRTDSHGHNYENSRKTHLMEECRNPHSGLSYADCHRWHVWSEHSYEWNVALLSLDLLIAGIYQILTLGGLFSGEVTQFGILKMFTDLTDNVSYYIHVILIIAILVQIIRWTRERKGIAWANADAKKWSACENVAQYQLAVAAAENNRQKTIQPLQAAQPWYIESHDASLMQRHVPLRISPVAATPPPARLQMIFGGDERED